MKQTNKSGFYINIELKKLKQNQESDGNKNKTMKIRTLHLPLLTRGGEDNKITGKYTLSNSGLDLNKNINKQNIHHSHTHTLSNFGLDLNRNINKNIKKQNIQYTHTHTLSNSGLDPNTNTNTNINININKNINKQNIQYSHTHTLSNFGLDQNKNKNTHTHIKINTSYSNSIRECNIYSNSCRYKYYPTSNFCQKKDLSYFNLNMPKKIDKWATKGNFTKEYG